MKTAIIALLGLTVPETTSRYDNDTELAMASGEYINATHALLSADGVDRYILLGTAKSIEKHRKSEVIAGLVRETGAEFVETPKDDLQKIFSVTIDLLKELEEKGYGRVVIDLTHSFRDNVMTSLMATMVSQAIYPLKISLNYAQEIERFKHYRFKSVDEEILGASNMATLFTTFTTTLRVPPLLTKTLIYDELSTLSDHLVSNQFREIYDRDLPRLKETLLQYRSALSFLGDHYEKLLEMVESIEATKEREVYEQFLFFAEFFLDKSYYLQASTYLIESITYYLGYSLKRCGWIDFDCDSYEKQQILVNLLRFNVKSDEFNFPNPYALEINYRVFRKFAELRESVADIRHNLAHINITKTYSEIGEALAKYIERYKELIEESLFENLDNSERNKNKTLSYRLQRLDRIHKNLHTGHSNIPKLKTVFEKFDNDELSKLTHIDWKISHKFCQKHEAEYRKLMDLQWRNIYMVEEE
jgi:hypothetical protein